MIGLEYLALISCAGFLAFLIPGRHRKYTAIVGWIFIVLTLFSLLPEYIRENNFMYPLFAVLSIPFLYITIRYLMKEDERVLNLSRGAAVAFLIYAPFGFDQVPLFASTGNWLIGVVAGQVAWILDALNFTVSLTCMNPATQRAMDIQFCGDAIRNTLTRNNLSVEIILGCTGIQSIAIMLGVAAAVPTTLRQKILAFLIVAPTIYILNLFRNAFVIMAYTDQWFPYYPGLVSNGEIGYESFFWAHNVIAELSALVILIIIAFGLFSVIPRLSVFADELFQLYLGEIRNLIPGKK